MLHSLGKKIGDYIIVGIVRTLYYKLNNVAFKLGRGLEIEEIISTIEIYYFSSQKKSSLKIFLLLIMFPPIYSCQYRTYSASVPFQKPSGKIKKLFLQIHLYY